MEESVISAGDHSCRLWHLDYITDNSQVIRHCPALNFLNQKLLQNVVMRCYSLRRIPNLLISTMSCNCLSVHCSPAYWSSWISYSTRIWHGGLVETDWRRTTFDGRFGRFNHFYIALNNHSAAQEIFFTNACPLANRSFKHIRVFFDPVL